jgi:radical SAM protein with 4Fe4S-binding SPASM domain
MPTARFTEILDKIRGKAKTLYFHIKGEPLLHPELSAFLDIAESRGFSVRLTTNGTLLAEWESRLRGKKNLDRLNVSLHSLAQYPPSRQDKIAREILAAADALREANRAVNPRFLVSLRLWTKDQTAETEKIAGILEGYFQLETGSVLSRLAGKNGMIIRENMTIHSAETFVWPSLGGTDFGPEGFCHGLRDQAGILADGTVVPCCLDGEGDIALGNILTEDWDSIMESPRARALYKSFGDRKIEEPLCRRCGYRVRFN